MSSDTNRDESIRAREAGREAMLRGEIPRAIRMLKIALRLDPSDDIARNLREFR